MSLRRYCLFFVFCFFWGGVASLLFDGFKGNPKENHPILGGALSPKKGHPYVPFHPVFPAPVASVLRPGTSTAASTLQSSRSSVTLDATCNVSDSAPDFSCFGTLKQSAELRMALIKAQLMSTWDL